MADGSVVIDTELDTSGLQQGLNQTNNNIRKTYAQLAQESGKTVEEIKQDVKNLAEEYQRQGMNIPNSYKKAYKEMGLYANSFEREAEDAADGAADETIKAAERIHLPWKTAFTGISKVAKTGIKAAATAITGLGAGMIAFGADAMKTGANFEAQMSKVKAISGATGDDFQMLVDKAREMGRATKFSATESGEALEYMAVA